MKKLFAVFILLAMVAIVFMPRPAYADTVTVCETACDHATIQAAVDAANPDDVIEIQVEGAHTEANIVVAKNLVIQGLGADVTTVQAAETACAVEGRVFNITEGNVELKDMAIRHGCLSDSFTGDHAGKGAGIWSAGALELHNTLVASNTVNSDGGVAVSGGGIFNTGSLRILDSAIAGNEARSNEEAAGGGIHNNGTAILGNVTVSGNFATDVGGGIQNEGTLGLYNSSVAENGATDGGDGLNNLGTLSIGNTLLVNNNSALASSQDCRTGTSAVVRDLGYNLVMSGNCSLPVVRRPEIGALTDNGGPTPTHALLAGSPALDAGDCTGDMLRTDQRGIARPQGGACDIGAFERSVLLFPIMYNPIIIIGADLVPIALTVEPSEDINVGSDVVLSVVFQNQGTEATPLNFWVDLAINPARPPEVAGDIWCTLCPTPPSPPHECADDLGLAWQVTNQTLAPGQTMTLTSNLDPYLVPSQTHWNGHFIRSGTQTLYVYVDSWGGAGVPDGWVRELSETNNRLGPVQVDVSGPGVAGASTTLFEKIPERGIPKN